MSNETSFEFCCPHCQVDLEARRSQIGTRVVCAGCHRLVMVPRPADDESIEVLMTASPTTPGETNALQEFDFDFLEPSSSEIEALTSSPADLAAAAEAPGDDLQLSPLPSEPQALAPPSFQAKQIAAELDAGLKANWSSDPAADETGPIRLDDFEELRDDETSAVVCRVCDTRIIFPNRQAGTMIKCPECYSEVLAIPRPSSADLTRDPLQRPVETAQVEMGDDGELRLADPEPVLKYKYGLDDLTGQDSQREFADPSGDLAGDVGESLSPLPLPTKPLEVRRPALLQSGSEPAAPATPIPRNSDSSTESLDEPELVVEERPVVAAPSHASTSSVPSPERPAVGPNPYQAPTQEGPDPREIERERNPLGMTLEGLGKLDFSVWRWLQTVFADTQLLMRLLLVAVSLTASYWLSDIVSHVSKDESLKPTLRSIYFVFAGLPAMVCWVMGWGGLFALGGLLMEAGSNRQPRGVDWASTNLPEYLAHLAQMAFPFWLAALPGLMIGTLVWLGTGSLLGMGLGGMFFGMLLAPLLYLGGFLNSSPVRLFSSKLKYVMGGGQSTWLVYLPAALVSWLLIFASSVLMWLDTFLIDLVAAVVHCASFIAFSSLTGLYCGLLGEQILKADDRAALQERMRDKAATAKSGKA